MEPVEATVPMANGHAMHYSRYGPAEASVTYVCLHGSPGTWRDFKYLAPRLVADDTNVLSFDLPGFGRTSAKVVGGSSKLTATSLATAVVDALQLLSLRHCIVVGHSMGGLTTLEVAAGLATQPWLKGAVFLNPAGLRPHKARWPITESALAWALRLAGPGSNPMTRWNHHIHVNGLKLPKATHEFDCANAVYRLASVDYDTLQTAAMTVVARRLPAFVAIATDDHVVEAVVGRELGEALRAQVIKEYANGGHHLQKTQAADLAHKLRAWTKDVVLRQPMSRL
ncbi:hypothetical protein SDRG_02425 [Saprolegnia diclina VS20]|uniref:AB hydrolase-1 domain-containing protein n=1 Tax=Saprolegnia diclina (strain VS20) TaxID=1156394 RepID=T0R2L2_SAPDV|nr:hypothetical protein SDRG_02425 [Saprolegnia diclina VS20]EQC40535.1 hypothetical protein SDRG_02425 [Saprolegnia diclina VS20]|eukprot:XP_008606234.1 hypothetical protein SDRG_02425 [Saprolegnia diclina VS20]